MNLESHVWMWLLNAAGITGSTQILSFSHACATEAFNLFLRTGALIVLGIVFSRVFGNWGAPVRSSILQVTLVAVALCPVLSMGFELAQIEYSVGRLPVAALTTSEARHDLYQDGASVDPVPQAGLTSHVTPLSEVSQVSVAATAETMRTVLERDRWMSRWQLAYIVLTLVWFVISAALLSRLALAYLWMRRVCRGARPAAASVQEICQGTANEMNVRCPELRVSTRVASPCLAGTWRPVILLPEAESHEAPDRIRAVCIHELAHLARRDCAWKLLMESARAMLFFQPLVKRLAREIEELTDEIADDYVVHYGAAREPYARQLTEIANRYRTGRLEQMTGVGVVALKSSVGRRVQRILDRTRRFSLRTRAGALAVILVLGICAMTTAALVGCGLGAESSVAPDMSGVLFRVSWVVDAGDPAASEDIVGRKRGNEAAKTYRVSKTVIFDDSDVESATVFEAPNMAGSGIAVHLSEKAGERLEAATRANLGKKLAIVVGDEVLSAPIVQGVIRVNAQITGFDKGEAADFAKQLNARAKYRKAQRVGMFLPSPSGVALDAGGKPAAGATVVLLPAGSHVTRSAFSVDTLEESLRKAGIPGGHVVKTDVAGRFALPRIDGPYLLVVESDAGYCERTGEDLLQSNDIRLKPWARVYGVVFGRSGPLRNEFIVVDAGSAGRSVGRKNDEKVWFTYGAGARTNERGEYSFDRLPEGEVTLERTNPEGTDAIMGTGVAITVNAGETKNVDLGAPICDVSGRLAVGEGATNLKIDLSKVRMSLMPDPNGKTNRNLGREEALKLSEMYLDFVESDRGAAYVRDSVPVSADGSFVIHGVPAGTLGVSAVAFPDELGADATGLMMQGGTSFQAPYTGGALDIGKIAVRAQRMELGPVGRNYFRIGGPFRCMLAAGLPGRPDMVRGAVVTFRKRTDGVTAANVELWVRTAPASTWRVTLTRRRADDSVFGKFSKTFSNADGAAGKGNGEWEKSLVDLDCPGWDVTPGGGARSLEVKVEPVA